MDVPRSEANGVDIGMFYSIHVHGREIGQDVCDDIGHRTKLTIDHVFDVRIEGMWDETKRASVEIDTNINHPQTPVNGPGSEPLLVVEAGEMETDISTQALGDGKYVRWPFSSDLNKIAAYRVRKRPDSLEGIPILYWGWRAKSTSPCGNDRGTAPGSY